MQQGKIDQRWHDVQPQTEKRAALPTGRLGGDDLVDAVDQPKVQRGGLPVFPGTGIRDAAAGTATLSRLLE